MKPPDGSLCHDPCARVDTGMMLSCFLGNSKHGLYCFCGAYAETWGVCVEQVGVKTPHFTFFGEAVRAANEAVEKVPLPSRCALFAM